MKTLTPLQTALETSLTPQGSYVRRRSSWYRVTKDVIQVVDLQKSSYGRQYYLNIAWWVKPLGDAEYPREELCHVRGRADSILASVKEFRRLMDMEQSVAADQRIADLADIISRELVPFLDSARTLDGLRDLHRAGKLKTFLIRKEAGTLLGDGPA